MVGPDHSSRKELHKVIDSSKVVSEEADSTNAVGEKKRAEFWLAANKTALDSSNEYVERYGLPLAKFRSL